ncbi:MAG TPA: c-type cytochrome [Isosphaeraceae bacterium]|nr:c-type cytochrome [Isosphaeraceae bacterium]
MSRDESTPHLLAPDGINPAASRLIFLAMLGLLVGGLVSYQLLSKPLGPPPPEVAKDPLLTAGRLIYFGRCATCHGNDGRGDGPIAADLLGPPVGNLTDNDWKHGDRPEQVMAVIREGVPNTRMTGWSNVLDPPEVRAVAAYVYYLAKRPVPEELRKP